MSIKETAGKVLLYLYRLQRTAPSEMRFRQLAFVDRKDGALAMTSDKAWFTKDLLDINSKSADLMNAFTFLNDKGLIQSTERLNAGARIYIGTRLTATGIDIVEGVEYGTDGKEAFGVTFNTEVDDGMNVESLTKKSLSKLLD